MRDPIAKALEQRVAITITDFEKLIVSERLVPSRNAAQRISRHIKAKLQGRSAEAFYQLVPGIMNAALAPSFSIATLISVLAQQVEWK